MAKKKEKIIAPENAICDIISDHNDVLICEYKGKRFSIRKELTEQI